MRVPKHACVLLIGLLVLLLPAALPAGSTNPASTGLPGTVTRIYDADTLEITPHGRVRLLGIDAPEKTPSARDAAFTSLGIHPSQLRPVHREGRAWCLRQLKGQQVTLQFDQTRRDRHGRLLAYVHLADGRLLNRVLLEKGLVITYRRFPFRLRNDFLDAERTARKHREGLWRRPLPGGNHTSTE